MKAVILCGGMGTRIRDVSSDVPKPMIPIGGQPILWHIIRFFPSGSPSVDVIPEALAVKASTKDFLGNNIKEIINSNPPVVEKKELFAPLNMKLWRDALGIQR